MTRTRRAFTLVELLVVIAIIVVLIGVMLPALGKARAATRKAACMSRVRGLAQTVQMYITSWNSLVMYDPTPILSTQWISPLTQYGNTERIRQCPEAQTLNGVQNSPGAADKPWNQSQTFGGFTQRETGAYGFNGWLYRLGPGKFILPTGDDTEDADADDGDEGGGGGTVTNNGLNPNYFYKLPIVKQAANIPVFVDATWSDLFPLSADLPAADLGKGTGNNPANHLGRACIARHGRSVGISFFDGHSENVPLDKLWTFDWNLPWKPPVPLPPLPKGPP